MRLSETNEQIFRLQKLLDSQFSRKAPQNIVETERSRLDDFKETALKLEKQIDGLKN
jgi:valyl-tRNA synthetase